MSSTDTPPPDAGDLPDDDAESEAELLQLNEDARREYLEQQKLYKMRLATLPSMQRISELWKNRSVREDDPVFMLIEVLSLHDARDQLSHTQAMRLHELFEKAAAVYVRQIRVAADSVKESREASLRLTAEAAALGKTAQTLGKYTEELGREMPSIIESIRVARQLLDFSTQRAKWQLVAIIGGSVCVGVLLGRFLG